MQFGQRLRRLLRGVTGRRSAGERPSVEDATPPPRARAPRLRTGEGLLTWRWAWRSAAGFVVLLALYYPLGSMLDHQINDDLDFAPISVPGGGSHAVAAASAMLTREVDETGWVANTPPFASNALLKYGGNMMNFQIGITTAIGIFSVELRDQIGRQRGTSAADPDLVRAASDIQYDPERWIWRLGRILPEASAEDQYKSARDHLVAYNQRLAAGEAVFDARTDNLLVVLDRIALDLGASSAQLEDQIIAGRRLVIDRQADKLLYNVKGRSYAYLMILRGMRTDFEEILAEHDTTELFDEMLEVLENAAGISPLITQNGDPEGVFANNHLAVQGFYVMRARTKLREITDILAK